MRKYNILVVEDHTDSLTALCNQLRGRGYDPVPFESGQGAFNYLKNRHSDNIPGYRRIAAVFCDYNVPGKDGFELLKLARSLDPFLPFYIMSAFGTHEIAGRFGQEGANGYINKPLSWERLDSLINKIFLPSYNFGKPVVIFKIGGSSDDVDNETDSLSLGESVDFFYSLQKSGNVQVVLTNGGGKQADTEKRRREKWAEKRPSVERKYPQRYAECVKNNSEYIKSLSGDFFQTIVPEDFSNLGVVDPYGPTELERKLASGEVLVMGMAPRHLGLGLAEEINNLGYGVVIPRSNRNYPNIPIEDSDAQTMLITKFFDANWLGLLKRTDGVYTQDPYTHFDPEQFKWFGNVKLRQKTKKKEYVTLADIIEENVSLQGAWDRKPGHLLERSAAALGLLFSEFEGVYVCHITPNEMYVQDRRRVAKRHAITGSVHPKPNEKESTIREDHLREIIKRRYLPDIRRS